MTFYEDLSSCDCFGRPGVWAVGWLEAGHPFLTGETSPARRELLKSMLVSPWKTIQFLGWHDCTLCRQARGIKNLFVPAGDKVFVAPELILHYVEFHAYSPPEIFWQALEKCPPQNTTEFFRALRAAGLNPATWWFPKTFGNPELDLTPEKHRTNAYSEARRLHAEYFPDEPIPEWLST